MHASGVQQLHLLKLAAEQNFNIKIDKCLHYNPTKWRTSPGFNLEDATDHPEGKNVHYTIQVAKNRIGQIDDRPYRKTVSGWLQQGPHGYEINSLTVWEAVTKHEEGLSLDLALPTDDELETENRAAKAIRESVTTPKS